VAIILLLMDHPIDYLAPWLHLNDGGKAVALKATTLGYPCGCTIRVPSHALFMPSKLDYIYNRFNSQVQFIYLYQSIILS